MPPHVALAPYPPYAPYQPYAAAAARVVESEYQTGDAFNEFQRWGQTFDVRTPVVSVANFLLIFLLKLNRMLLPLILRWLRARRLAWIKRAYIDVAKEIRDHPNRRQLCAGCCCRDTYDITGSPNNNEPALMGADVSRDVDGMPKQSTTTGSMANMMESWVSAFEADETDSEDSDAEGTRKRHVYRERVLKKMGATSDNPEEDIYYRLRAIQEERHREMFIGKFNYSEVVAMYVTLVALVVYSTLIIWWVLSHYEFSFREAWVFSVSLVMAGITSEIDTLVMFQRRVKAGAKHMLPNMPGFYALRSLSERAQLMTTDLMDGINKNAERLKKKPKKKRSRAKRSSELSSLNQSVISNGDPGNTGNTGDVETAPLNQSVINYGDPRNTGNTGDVETGA